MIRCTTTGNGLQAGFTNGRDNALADAARDHGGGEEGFESFELLEAALATCACIVVRYYADRHDIPLTGVSCRASVDKSNPRELVLEYGLELQGPLTAEQRTRLCRAAEACPVRQALAGKVSFRELTGAEARH